MSSAAVQNITMVKHACQQTLKRIGLYNRVQSSILYDAYWAFSDRTIIMNRRRELAFYAGLLAGFRPGDLIFDLGANRGSKTDIFVRLGARVVAVEPDRANQAVLKEKFLDFRINPKPVVIVGKAVSNSTGTGVMWVDQPGSAMNTLNEKWVDILRMDEKRFGQQWSYSRSIQVETTTLEELFTTYAVPFFIKIDVEGYEFAVLKGLKRPVRFLSFEVNLPEFYQEALGCVGHLSRLSVAGEFNYTRDCRLGLQLEQWVGADAFTPFLSQCTHPSIEVFWRTPAQC